MFGIPDVNTTRRSNTSILSDQTIHLNNYLLKLGSHHSGPISFLNNLAGLIRHSLNIFIDFR